MDELRKTIGGLVGIGLLILGPLVMVAAAQMGAAETPKTGGCGIVSCDIAAMFIGLIRLSLFGTGLLALIGAIFILRYVSKSSGK